jgi:chromosome segregation protein
LKPRTAPADLDRQRQRLEEDRSEADRLTRDAADALARLERELTSGEEALRADEARRPAVAAALDDADRSLRTAELALAKATADQAGVEAEWRVADAELSAAQQRLVRLDGEVRRQDDLRAALAARRRSRCRAGRGPRRRDAAAAKVAEARAALEAQQARRKASCRPRAMLPPPRWPSPRRTPGVEREHTALLRDREARARQASAKHGLPVALDRVRAAPGYERALAAVLGRDAKAPLGAAPDDGDGRFWTGAQAPAPVADSLAAHVSECPQELAARLALVHVAEQDDGRALAPGEWLVTLTGRLRRWDGFVARGEGAAEAARLEADNRFAALEAELPPLRAELAFAEAQAKSVQDELAAIQTGAIAAERALAAAAEAERAALRAVDQAEAAKARLETRRAELAAAATDLAEQRAGAEAERAAAEERRAALPDPAAGRAQLAAAQARHDGARSALQTATAALAAHDQAIAVARERTNAQRSDIRSWQARAGDAAGRLAQMTRRFEEIEEERGVVAAKPAGLMREIEDGEAVRTRLAAELAAAETRVGETAEAARRAEQAFAAANEALASAREARAGAAARAENEEAAAPRWRAFPANASSARRRCCPSASTSPQPKSAPLRRKAPITTS